ncbi:transcription factor TFIIIC subunit tfc4 [Steccherinum ochraceum]|uniref:Transcription factor TFIIIC subunit tfc4 n=1 Tax=Steccherinum ochraceum TaxID=92696 RepID=A0A4R0RPM9_9APHY|nr:transcription factor TFIIIC subunit tfc4 [Steccherinum ochraceum]
MAPDGDMDTADVDDEYEESTEYTSEEDDESADEGDGGESLGEGSSQDVAVDADFDRLVQDIRRSSSGSSSGILGSAWNLNFDPQAQDAEFLNDLREASGIGKRKKKRGRRPGVTLSPEVQALLGEANQAYIDGDVDSAMRTMQEVIRIESRAHSAWQVLARCFEHKGSPDKALGARIMAAHLSNDPEEWSACAEESRNIGNHKQALYCYQKLYRFDPSNINALWDRAALAKDVGELRIASTALQTILKHVPHDLPTLEELRPILIELSSLDRCTELFLGAFEHYQQLFPLGIGPGPDGVPASGGGFGLMEILVLADLQNTLGQYDKAIETIRKGCRWLQGRSKQVFWDDCEDDREYDTADVTRPSEGELQPGMSGDIAEGKLHANIVLAEDVKEYAPLFGEIADAYHEKRLFAEAGQIYEVLGGDPETSSIHILMQAADCRRVLGDLKEAAEVYEHIIAADPTHRDAKLHLAETYENLGEIRKALDLALQVCASRKRNQSGGRQGSSGPDTDQPRAISLFDEQSRKAGKSGKSQRLSMAELRQAETSAEKEVVLWYHRVTELWPKMLLGQEDAVREWLVEAEKLIEMFRHTRPLFSTTGHQGFRGMFPRSTRRKVTEASEDSLVLRLQLELGGEGTSQQRSQSAKGRYVDNFRTITFDDWLRLFMQYAFLLTSRDEFDFAVEILKHISWSNAFQNRAAQDTIRFAIITCAIHGDRYPVAVEQARKLVNTHQFNNEPFRILLASLGHGMHATDAFLASTLSKHLLRELKTSDMAFRDKDSLKWNNVTKRYAPVTPGKAKDEDDDDDVGGDAPDEPGKEAQQFVKPKIPTKQNPMGVAVYGQICLAARSYQSALFYLLHAYEMHQEDPMICLCLAIASIGRAMQRQADNRHHLITQGLAFLSKYRSLRGEDSSQVEEVEYNFGRAFHQLGLLTHAARHYERVLEATETRLRQEEEDPGVARTAAYNLSLVYVSTGATPKAEALYRRWLSV